eukprot:6174584-Pleurochrysis_carterae.AAC.1
MPQSLPFSLPPFQSPLLPSSSPSSFPVSLLPFLFSRSLPRSLALPTPTLHYQHQHQHQHQHHHHHRCHHDHLAPPQVLHALFAELRDERRHVSDLESALALGSSGLGTGDSRLNGVSNSADTSEGVLQWLLHGKELQLKKMEEQIQLLSSNALFHEPDVHELGEDSGPRDGGGVNQTLRHPDPNGVRNSATSRSAATREVPVPFNVDRNPETYTSSLEMQPGAREQPGLHRSLREDPERREHAQSVGPVVATHTRGEGTSRRPELDDGAARSRLEQHGRNQHQQHGSDDHHQLQEHLHLPPQQYQRQQHQQRHQQQHPEQQQLEGQHRPPADEVLVTEYAKPSAAQQQGGDSLTVTALHEAHTEPTQRSVPEVSEWSVPQASNRSVPEVSDRFEGEVSERSIPEISDSQAVGRASDEISPAVATSVSASALVPGSASASGLAPASASGLAPASATASGLAPASAAASGLAPASAAASGLAPASAAAS